MGKERLALGIDVGGTFTDLALVRLSDGAAFYYKTSSTPHDPSEAMTRGLIELLKQSGVPASDIAYFGHGTTVATNALIVGKVAPTGLITTEGFRDILEIRRQRQPHNYDIRMPKPTPLVPRHLRREIRERTYLFGRENTPPQEDTIPTILADFRSEGVEAIAICFLHAYHNPAHEARIAEAVRTAFPQAFVCASHEVLAEFREYERISTTVLNASLGPVMQRYLRNLEDSAKTLGIVAPTILQSNGGVASTREVEKNPVRTLASGPAAGVTGAVHVCKIAGFPDIITFDVGGTSTDVCLIEGGEPLIRREREFNGYPVRIPMMDVHSVGAGGGSIAWVDSGGFLHVGPQSAGAFPGPACYGLGGTEPTVTDANVLLGRLPHDALLGGRMPIDRGLACKAVEEKVARPMGLGLEEAAHGILTILNENMIQAIRVISVEQGFDPRQFTLVAFGGAGPLLAAPLARELGLGRVLVPSDPGLLCALGLLVADVRSDFSMTRMMALDAVDMAAINASFVDLEADITRWFDKERIPPKARRIERAIDMRYVGQSHELTVKVGNGVLLPADLTSMVAEFKREHERFYGYASEGPLQLLTFRATAKAKVLVPPNQSAGTNGSRPATMPKSHRQIWFKEAGGYVDTPIYDRDVLGPDTKLKGPAIIEQMDTTTVLLPGQTLVTDINSNIIMTC
jgi:N-methylhydantoinase A